MSNLKSLQDRVELANARKKEKTKALADRPIFELKIKKRADGSEVETKQYNAHVGFAIWNKALEDTNSYGYQETPDDKLNQCMKSFMKFLHETERLSEEEVKNELRRVVLGWVAIPDSVRTVPATTKEGKPYNLRLSDIPNFRMFYFNSAPIRALITRYAEAPNAENQTTRATVESEPQGATYDIFGDD